MPVPSPRPTVDSQVTDKAVLIIERAAAAAALRWSQADVTKVCVALSGGMDSVVLLHALSALAKKQSSWSLSAHHIHHGLSPNADAWVAHCESVCAAVNVSFSCTRERVDRSAGIGLEASARAARYAALDSLNTDIVALAHHARDQAETVLLQLLRGAGPNGLAAMPRMNRRYSRPLLDVPRAAVHTYALAHSLAWIEDESNLDTRFARNRLRLNVWPALTAAFPSAEATLARSAALQAEAAVLLRELATIDLQAISDAEIPRVSRLMNLSTERQANVFRHWLAEESMPVPSSDTLHEWLSQLSSTNATQAIKLGFAKDGPSVRVYRDHLLVERSTGDWPAVTWVGEPEVLLGAAAGSVTFTETEGGATAAIRRIAPGETWCIRKRLPGDRVRLSAASGHVSLKNVMQSANVPPWMRDVWPLLICNNEIAAIAGLLTANDYKVRPGERGLACEWKPAWSPAPRS